MDAPVDVEAVTQKVLALAQELEGIRPHLWRLGSDRLEQVVEGLGLLVRASEAAMAGVAAEAVQRGVVQASQSAGTTAWVRERAGVTEPGRAHAVAQVAEASLEPGTEPLAAAVWGGGVSVSAAHTMLRESEKVRPVLPGADREQVLGYFLEYAGQLGERGGWATDRELRQLTRQVVARFGEDALDRRDEAARECSSLTERRLATGLTRFQLDLNEPDAARFRAATNGLAGPRSVRDEAGERVRDPRSAARRRADAVMEIVERAQAAEADQAGGGFGLSGSTSLIVTMDHETLAAKLAERSKEAGATGWSRGLPGQAVDAGPAAFATTTSGEVLTPAQVRQAACDALVVPMVLGSGSAPLDVGRAIRFATRAQRASLVQRDGGCTFPGCDRPPGWCHAHHIEHWADGGPTDLGNLVLLCQRHHTVVHRDGLAARWVDDRWEWFSGEPPG